MATIPADTLSTGHTDGPATALVPGPYGVHMVGSVPHLSLKEPSEVWAKLFSSLPGRLSRVPDGELGDRYYYVNWQAFVFPEAVRRGANMVGDHSSGKADNAYIPKLEDIQPLGYDEAAIQSYHEFLMQRHAGAIPKGVRFQVSLPSPVEAIAIHVDPAYQAVIAPLYEQRMLECLRRIQENIPSKHLSIQWDVACTFGMIETERGNLDNPYFKPWAANATENCIEALKKVSFATDKDVEMGYHLCYGDVEHQHFVQPKDASLLVEIANRMIRDVHPAHPISYIHLPVPKDRSDDAYFAPLRQLALPEEAQLFLGVVHFDDLQGTKQRIAVAKKFVPKVFGVATECGMGRTPKEQLDSILSVAREVSEPYSTDRILAVL